MDRECAWARRRQSEITRKQDGLYSVGVPPEYIRAELAQFLVSTGVEPDPEDEYGTTEEWHFGEIRVALAVHDDCFVRASPSTEAVALSICAAAIHYQVGLIRGEAATERELEQGCRTFCEFGNLLLDSNDSILRVYPWRGHKPEQLAFLEWEEIR